jgi:tRNA threonylcarbamoyladenosine biosynthesis protein TsaE
MSEFECITPESLEALGTRIARHAHAPLTIFLRGQLGAGKTTFARGFIRGCGHTGGAVKSPTFTLVEPYSGPQGVIYHFDLFRIDDPEELELAGLRDYFDSESIRLVEWPERARDRLGSPDLLADIKVTPAGRHVSVTASTPRGTELLTQLESEL